MSQEQPDAPPSSANARGWNLLAGVAISAVLWGGLYCGWTSWTALQSGFVAASAPPPSAAFADQNVAQESVGAPSLTPSAKPASLTFSRRIHAREAARIRPARAMLSDDNALVVHAARRLVWARRPSASSLAEAYPTRALEAGREGQASVRCTIRNSGALNCMPLSETPTHAGFGEAALQVARMFRQAPRRADEGADGSTLDLRVVFRIEGDGRRRDLGASP